MQTLHVTSLRMAQMQMVIRAGDWTMDKYQNKYRVESARLQHYDYGQSGLYFITICTANHEHLFGDIIDDEMQLSHIGVLADVLWHEIKNHSKNVVLHEFVVMPNHIHGIIEIVESDVKNTNNSDVTGNVSTMAKMSPKSGSLGRIIGSYKAALTKHANRLGLAFNWQMRFYDHIIRDDESLSQIQQYIMDNPQKWADDKLFTLSNRRDVTCNVSDAKRTNHSDVACNVSTDTPPTEPLKTKTLRATSLRKRGFTLVELVVTIVIIGILSSLGGMFITRPIESYIDLERRTELVDQAESALRRMQRDIRAALPNSLREIEDEISGKTIGIEFLHVVDGGRYRRAVDPDAVSDPDLMIVAAAKSAVLDFTIADTSFEVLGDLQHFAYVTKNMPDEKDNDKVVIYNLSAIGTTQNAYLGDNLKELGVSTSSSVITLGTGGMRFLYSSPYQRFFIIDKAVSYKIVGTELRRYAGYDFDNDPGPDSNGTDDLVAQYLVLADSSFTYNSSTASRSGLVTIQLALEDEERAAGERITLLHQVHVDNAP